MRKPEGLSKGAAQVTAADIEEFISGIEKYLDERGLTEFVKCNPGNLVNIDETAFELNAKPDKVLTDKDIQHTYYRNAAGHHKKITATVTVGADGKMWTPQIIFNESFTKTTDVALAAGCKFMSLFVLIQLWAFKDFLKKF